MDEMLEKVVKILCAVFDEETLKDFVDAGLDYIEDEIEAEPDWYDDAALAAIAHVRAVLGVPDDDEEEVEEDLEEEVE